MRHRSPCLSLLLCAALLPSALSCAGEKPTVDYVLKVTTLSGAPGATIQLEISGPITPGYHTYTTKTAAEYGDETIPISPTEFELEPANLLKQNGKAAYSAPKMMKEESSGKQVEIFEDHAAFTIPVKIAADAKPGEYPAKLTVDSQVCKRQCYRSTKELKFTLKVTGGVGLPGLDLSSLGLKKHAGSVRKNVEWSLKETTISAARGQTVQVDVQGVIPDGFHIYSTKTVEEYGADVTLRPTEFAVGPAELLKRNGKAAYPAPHMTKDPFVDARVETFEKTVTFRVPVQIARDAKPGDYAATLTVKAQMCNEQNCLDSNGSLPFTLKITGAPVVIEAAPAAGAKETPGPQAANVSSEIQRARQEGLGAYLLLAFGAGATALLTPCVFPMIPITVSFFTKRKHVSRNRSIRDAFIYSLGIVFTFTGLGFIFALALGASGITDFATNPWVNLGVAGVFILLAGSLFGWYEIQLPTGLLNKLNSKANEGEGIVSVLLMGLVFSLTSFTCTVPFVGGVMVAATQGDWLWPLLGMMVFSTVFSTPFFLLALFPAALKSLPKSGGWLNSVKVVMGFLEIAAAMKFLSNADIVWQWEVLTRNVFLLVWIALAVLAVLYLVGKIRFAHDTPLERMSGLRMLTATGFASTALFLAGGMLGWVKLGILEAYVPAKNYASSGDWLEDFDEGLAQAKKSGRPIFVDFTGYTCVNCRLMEEEMFPRPEIAPLLRKFVRVRLHTDGRKNEEQKRKNRANQALQQARYSTTALPFYAIIAPDNTDIEQFKDGLTYDVDAFAEFLKRGLGRKAAGEAPKPAPPGTTTTLLSP